jgi:hypothetical protein
MGGPFGGTHDGGGHSALHHARHMDPQASSTRDSTLGWINGAEPNCLGGGLSGEAGTGGWISDCLNRFEQIRSKFFIVVKKKLFGSTFMISEYQYRRTVISAVRRVDKNQPFTFLERVHWCRDTSRNLIKLILC